MTVYLESINAIIVYIVIAKNEIKEKGGVLYFVVFSNYGQGGVAGAGIPFSTQLKR